MSSLTNQLFLDIYNSYHSDTNNNITKRLSTITTSQPLAHATTIALGIYMILIG